MDTIDEVMDYVKRNPEYRAQIGVIKLDDGRRTFLTWAAIHRHSDDYWVPSLKTLLKFNPSAHWVPLTADELHDYLHGNHEAAFLISDKRPVGINQA